MWRWRQIRFRNGNSYWGERDLQVSEHGRCRCGKGQVRGGLVIRNQVSCQLHLVPCNFFCLPGLIKCMLIELHKFWGRTDHCRQCAPDWGYMWAFCGDSHTHCIVHPAEWVCIGFGACTRSGCQGAAYGTHGSASCDRRCMHRCDMCRACQENPSLSPYLPSNPVPLPYSSGHMACDQAQDYCQSI
jgi:hypothetical protein